MEIFRIAGAAITEQTKRLEESAARVAKTGDPKQDPPVDLAREAVVRIEADNAVRANLKVIKSEDERTKYLLDILA